MTNEGDIVFDPFMGAGSTQIAAIINNRRTAGTELNEKYYNIATERVTEALTGRLKSGMINLFIPHQPGPH